MSFWNDFVDIVTTPITAPVKAVGAIVSGENIAASLASATPLGQIGQVYGSALQAAGVSAPEASTVPIIGSDIANVINYSNNPYSLSNAANYGLTAGKIGGAAYLGFGEGFSGAATGYQIGSNLQEGNIAGAIGAASGYLGDYGDYANLAAGFLGGGGSQGQGQAPVVGGNAQNYPSYSTYTSDNQTGMIVVFGILSVAAWYFLRRK